MKTIVVLGATGEQGTAIINTLLTHRTYRIRAVTRNLTSPKALALSQQGIEVVPGDFDDKASLISAFQDASAIYAVTDFWAPFIGGLSASEAQALETRHGKNIVDAALEIPNLEHFIW
ncbi:uncharacterized protein LAJ45_05383 [Morchella importuna]|uniref:uncharacterized protein n=1 Tax=Morchella importuna TaxID=1174673 RepID=UPI001E8D700B|nr:uncharacterized protein LAJ45_05383 [Morchella importuna]KAH8150687.1 hypothetical protein LAJ45_05383 [Morchella importuna]